MTLKNGKLDQREARVILDIEEVKRLAGGEAAAWEGETSKGHRVHLGYRPGHLVGMVWLPSRSGSGRWVQVLDCNPHLLEAESALERWANQRFLLRERKARVRQEMGGLGMASPVEAQNPWVRSGVSDTVLMEQKRRELRLTAACQVTAEIRAWTWRDGNAKTGPAAVPLHRIREWLETRDQLLDKLEAIGIAGGKVRMRLLAGWDGGQANLPA